jgi:predicted outer membrane repeat protein
MKTKSRFTFLFSLALILALTVNGLASATPARAVGNIIYVNDDASGATDGTSWTDAYKRLQNALAAAASGDQIWVAAGIYYPDEGAAQTNNNRGESFQLVNGVAVYGGFDPADTQLSERNPSVNIAILSGDISQDDTNTDGNNIAESTTHIQGSNAYNVVSNISGTIDSTAILDGFVITAGKADGSPLQSTTVGGGVRLMNANSPTLANLTIIGNDALANGGGMFNGANANPALTGVTFTGNHANNGGGVYTDDSNPSFTAVTFNGNSADNGGGMTVTVTSAPTLTNVIFTNNSALVSGGGIVISNSTPSLIDVTMSGNSADLGGGMYIGALSHPGLTNVTISQNTADHYGGGVYLLGNTGSDFAYITAQNITISDNDAVISGGGIYSNYGNATLTNVTFSDNSAGGSGGGIYNDNLSASYFRNALVANSVGGDCVNTGGSGSVVYHSLFEDVANACGAVNNVDGNILGVDPKLGPLQNNGGLTKTQGLLSGSPAINTGTNSACPSTDQTGLSRPQGSTCDIGAAELPHTILTVKSVAANDGWVFESTETSGMGGSMNSTSTLFYVGDGAADKQYIAILHFNTTGLPDTAIITKATLKIKKYAVVGTDPFTILGGLLVDMRKPSFGAVGLSFGDFQTVAGRVGVSTFGTVPVSNWYSAVLNGSGRNYINKTGTTQFRLRFATDDNEDGGTDYIKFYSGNHANSAVWPVFVIEYYVP